jgi:hypothetical protein
VRVKIKAGAEFDVVTPQEARDIWREQALDLFGQPPTELVRAEESGVTVAGGALLLPIYVVPLGMEFRVHVIVVEADGVNPATPFNGAGAYWQIRVSGRVVDEASLVAAAANGSQIPFVKTYGYMQGPVALNGEPLELNIVAGPAAGTSVRALAQGTLVPRTGAPPEK